MSLDNSVSDVAEGAFSATFKLGINGLKTLVQKFRDRKIAFIQDEKTLEKVREDLKSNELKFYKSYLSGFDLINTVLIGLTLRRLEEAKDFERLEKLRAKIFSRYDAGGVHIAQAVQSGIVSRYINYLLEIRASEQVIRKRLMVFLEEIDSHVSFITFYTDETQEINRITTKININSPEVFVISGMGSATQKAEKVIKEVDKKDISNYYREDYSRSNGRIAFFHRTLLV